MTNKPATAPATPDAGASVQPELSDQIQKLIFASATPEEMEGMSARDRAHLAATALAQLAQRQPGTHKIFVGAGEGEAGHRRMPVILVNDDMPFLVDSVSATVSGQGLEITRLFHPVIPVRRDSSGQMLSIDDPDAPRESLIVMEVARAPARKRGNLAQDLDRTLTDVRAAVTDWQAMLSMLRSAGRTLNDNPPPLAPHQISESIAFLEWLANDNFTFLGASDGQNRLGILRDAIRWPLPDPSDHADGRTVVTIHKGSLRSTVHRTSLLDIVTVLRYDRQGAVAGAFQFAGIFSSQALRESPRRVPLIRRKVAEVAERLGHEARSHAGRALAHVIETFPREELFQIDADHLQDMTAGLLSLQDRPRPALFARCDVRANKASVLAYIPRDDYSAVLRASVGQMLERELGGQLNQFDVELRAEGLARVHYVLDNVSLIPPVAGLNAELVKLTRGWDDELEIALTERAGPVRGARLALTHGRAFGPGYRAEFTPAEAADDILRLASLSTPADRHVALFRNLTDTSHIVRLKIYRLGEVIPLSDSVPILENFGFRVIEEVPFDLADGEIGWIHDFKLELAHPLHDFGSFAALVQPALTAVLAGQQENDAFNSLIPVIGISAEEANWFRAWFRYLRQTGSSYSLQTVVEALKRNAPVTSALIALFRARHQESQQHEMEAADRHLLARLDDVSSIEDDRILRLFRSLLMATLRTNAFIPGGPEALAFKLDPALVPGLPKPLPWREIWVYSPRVEGIHLRGGPIARGGLRWSDRRDDFRTEVLGLVKAQIVKNSVIVPTGAKGGFYPKLLPDPAHNRDAWAAEGRASYQIFIRALLSVTDNLDKTGAVIPPAYVVRHDQDDAYLVVAADKGTASFSDTANEIALNHGFWLGDAFASGGSAGYDHKEMGITARGAWVSVTRHFAEMGIDVSKDPVTVAGVGDMSGDVFGNGMLLSRAIRLVAAFDHRHIFLDPSPDPARSHAERERLFHLQRSSWADYDASLISEGGGVWPRTQKSIPLSPQVRALLQVEAEEMGPSELISAILKAPVDLLWFGGIGTYVKCSAESNAEVGDRANDPHRVDGGDVRARVIGEGANLGVTQAGRVEYASRGGRLNTDFIDNSAGVDTSDHEVNIKIALDQAVRADELAPDNRNALLAEMTAEVAGLVLSDNEAQTLALSVAESQAVEHLTSHARLMEVLEASGRLNRKVEGLPSARDLDERQRTARGLTRPELALLLSYAKMDLKEGLATSQLVSDPLLLPDLATAFPPSMRGSFAARIETHPLAREIVATKLANLMVNRGGLTLAHDLSGELGCPLVTVSSAFVSARTLFDLPELWADIDNAAVPARLGLMLHAEAATITRLLVADLAQRTGAESAARLSARLAPGLSRIIGSIDRFLRPEPRAQVEAVRQRMMLAGAPASVTDRVATLHALTGAAGVVALASDLSIDEYATAEAYTRLGEALGIDWAKGATSALALTDPWERLLAATTARQFETMRLNLIRRLTGEGEDPMAHVQAWLDSHSAEVQALADTIATARQNSAPTLAMLAHLATMAASALLH